MLRYGKRRNTTWDNRRWAVKSGSVSLRAAQTGELSVYRCELDRWVRLEQLSRQLISGPADPSVGPPSVSGRPIGGGRAAE
jgi:hypothetical protein